MYCWDPFDSQLSVQFEYLRILRVHGVIPSEILTRVVAPALEELHIEANSLHMTSIDELLFSFELICPHLYALLPEGTSVANPMWPTSFSKLVEKCTRLDRAKMHVLGMRRARGVQHGMLPAALGCQVHASKPLFVKMGCF